MYLTRPPGCMAPVTLWSSERKSGKKYYIPAIEHRGSGESYHRPQWKTRRGVTTHVAKRANESQFLEPSPQDQWQWSGRAISLPSEPVELHSSFWREGKHQSSAWSNIPSMTPMEESGPLSLVETCCKPLRSVAMNSKTFLENSALQTRSLIIPFLTWRYTRRFHSIRSSRGSSNRTVFISSTLTWELILLGGSYPCSSHIQ